MITRLKILATASIAGCTVLAGVFGGGAVLARQSAAGATATATATAADTPAAGTATLTPASAASGTETPTSIAVKPIVHNPTPIPGIRKHLTLPKPVVLEVGIKSVGVGLTQKNALATANTFVKTLFVLAPTYVAKGWTLQLIHVDPAQDQQTPAAAYLQFVPKGLTTAKGTYPSYYVYERSAPSTIIYPGVTPKVVTINRGKRGIGVVKGTLVDIKPKNGNEIVHIIWSRLNVSYDVSSNISVSKVPIKDLLAVASSVQ
jgi:hypothetical protein